MHELRFANEIIDTLKKASKEKKIAGDVTVNVRLSTMSHVTADNLKGTFKELAADTEFKNVRLNVIPLEIKVNCRSCGQALEVSDPHAQCLACGSDDIAVSFEREFYVESIEIEDE